MQFALAFLALLCGQGRIRDNKHHPSDVIAGWILGCGVAVFMVRHLRCVYIYLPFYPHSKRRKTITVPINVFLISEAMSLNIKQKYCLFYFIKPMIRLKWLYMWQSSWIRLTLFWTLWFFVFSCIKTIQLNIQFLFHIKIECSSKWTVIAKYFHAYE